jgi:hypothetical protein
MAVPPGPPVDNGCSRDRNLQQITYPLRFEVVNVLCYGKAPGDHAGETLRHAGLEMAAFIFVKGGRGGDGIVPGNFHIHNYTCNEYTRQCCMQLDLVTDLRTYSFRVFFCRETGYWNKKIKKNKYLPKTPKAQRYKNCSLPLDMIEIVKLTSVSLPCPASTLLYLSSVLGD